ncbi:MAG: 4Fe-4S dicluster domain-containing protein [Candidatus Odinarchaeota archaeon]
MQKILFADPEKCTGCRTCEATCSLHNEKVFNPERSRIRIVKWEQSGIYIPMVCQQCVDPVCATVCPMHAIHRDEKTGAMIISYEDCIGCKYCVQHCPFGGVVISKNGRIKSKKIIKCDLCGGDPRCVKNCEPGALQYVEASTINQKKRKIAAEKFSELVKKALEV